MSRAPAAPEPAPAQEAAIDARADTDTILVLDDGAHVAGYVCAGSITIAPGARVYVDADVQLVAARNIYLDGVLVVPDRTERVGTADAPDIELLAGNAIVGWGAIVGGRGLSFDPARDPGAAGGDGSAITLRAPKIWVMGSLRGGAGGHGGGGGAVLCIGGTPESGEFPAYGARAGSIVGGDGGPGGRGCAAFGAGGAGGAAGDAGFFADDAAARAR
ncbi:MAG: hypothetical protein EPO68_02010 [Planctomycetota bacterium]|nr:MAG: hypothetical protein EPO68_02010 [Planctomycetota bacterium]